MMPREALYGYSPTGAVLTLVLPLALFIVVMIGLSIVFHQPRTVPGRQPAPDRAVPPAAKAAQEDGPGDGDDTAVSETLVTDPPGGADAGGGAVRDTAAGDAPSGGTAVGDPVSPETPEDPE
jgi:hypothetical protein